jgi:hypothetical protein
MLEPSVAPFSKATDYVDVSQSSLEVHTARPAAESPVRNLNLEREDVHGTLNETRVIAHAAFSKPKLFVCWRVTT